MSMSLAELDCAINIELELAMDPLATKHQIAEALQRAIECGEMRRRQRYQRADERMAEGVVL